MPYVAKEGSVTLPESYVAKEGNLHSLAMTRRPCRMSHLLLQSNLPRLTTAIRPRLGYHCPRVTFCQLRSSWTSDLLPLPRSRMQLPS